MSYPGVELEVDEARCREAEEIFELCEGSLESGRERALLAHLRGCPECRRIYRQESSLSAVLSNSGKKESKKEAVAGTYGAERRRGSISSAVAMSIPTRSASARAVWGLGAAALLVAALFSLSLHSVRPITFINDLMAACWGLTSGLSDAAAIILAVSGWTILVTLLVGVFADALIAVTLLAVARWWRPRGA